MMWNGTPGDAEGDDEDDLIRGCPSWCIPHNCQTGLSHEDVFFGGLGGIAQRTQLAADGWLAQVE
jgi:hypothetical protein